MSNKLITKKPKKTLHSTAPKQQDPSQVPFRLKK